MVQKALGQDNIDELLKLSEEYIRGEFAHKVNEKRRKEKKGQKGKKGKKEEKGEKKKKKISIHYQ